MPRTISANLQTHLALGVTTLNFLWEITRVDATVFRYTDADANIIYDSNTYKAVNSAGLSAIQQTDKLNVDNFDFSVILNDSDIAKEDIRGGLFDYAQVKVWVINRETVADGVIALVRGQFGETVMMGDETARVEFRSLSDQLNMGIGRVYGHECDADLGDTRCGVTLATYTETGTVTSVQDNRRFYDTSRTEADNFFNYGLLTWTSGNNNGLTMEVKDYILSTTKMVLMAPMPYTVQVGDTYSAHRGCKKTKGVCKNTFDNLVNFRGFHYIPGYDKISIIVDVNDDAGLHE